MRKHDCFCQIHRVWYAQDCPPCVAEAQARATVIYIDGEPHKPADVLRRARRVSGMSQNAVAKSAHIAWAQVSKWETGVVTPMLPLWIRAMAACGYRVTVEKIK
jgi:DNA-binding XRE family transcriptional regulator